MKAMSGLTVGSRRRQRGVVMPVNSMRLSQATWDDIDAWAEWLEREHGRPRSRRAAVEFLCGLARQHVGDPTTLRPS